VKKTAIVFLLWLTACGTQQTQVKPTDATVGGPPAVSLDVETYQLDNGLTVLLSQDHRLPVVAVEVRYLVGSGHERQGRSGFAHLFEHLMFQGSENYNDEYFKPLQPIGASVNGTTNVDRTNYYERVPSEYLELALWLESDRMENLLPALTQEKLDNQREVVKNERRQSYEDRPYGTVWMHMHHNLYPKAHPYGHTTIGSHEDLTAASLDDVKGFFRQHYSPTNAVVTIVGDFEKARAKELVELYFGHLPAAKRTPWPEFTEPVLTENKHIVEEDEVKLPGVFMAWHTPKLYGAGDAELDILASVLASGKSSRLYKPLVYDQKIASSVSAFQVSMAMGGFFVVQAIAAPGHSVEELHAALTKALEEALATPATEDEMSRAVNGWKKYFFGKAESVLSRAQLLSNYYHVAGDADYITKDLARYTGLTADDIHKVGNTYLGQGKHVRIDVVPVTEKDTDAKGGK
jgi:zinc protease